jgi:hypothetical protein
MEAWNNFWRLEKEEAGWRFWLAWVILSSIGFFTGLAIGRFFAGLLIPNPAGMSDKIGEAVIIGAVFATLTGLLQGILLQRHGIPRESWTLATGFGWIAGTLLAGVILFTFDPEIDTADLVRWLMPAGFIAGAVVGIPQWLVMRRHVGTIGWWWILVSSIAWGVILPGVINGLVLARLLPKQEPKRRAKKKKSS